MSDRLTALLATHFSVPMSWPGALAMALAVLLVGGVLYVWVFRILARLAATTSTELDDLLLRRMRAPAKVLVALVAVHTLLALREVDLPFLQSAVTTIELLLLAYLVIEAAETFIFQWWLTERKGLAVPAVVRHLVLIVLYTAVVLSVLATATGMNLVPVLATSTVVTVVVGLALQDTLGNLFSGLALHIERPFTLGDWVMVEGVDGVVVYTGWRSTHLRTLSGDIVTFPNSVVARARVQNYSAPDRLTARKLDVPVRVGAPPDVVEEAVRIGLARVPAVRAEPEPKVWLVGVTPLQQRYVVKLWINDYPTHDDIESDVLKSLWYALNDAGVALSGLSAAPGVELEDGAVASARSKTAKG